MNESKLQEQILILTKEMLRAHADISVILTILCEHNIVTKEEINSVRERILKNTEYSTALTAVHKHLKEVREESKLEDLLFKYMSSQEDSLTSEEKKYVEQMIQELLL